jgi:hypothetical protein
MSTLSFNDFCNAIPDLKENIINGSVKVIPLKKGKKAPRDNGWSKKEYTLHDLEKWDGNFGIMPGHNHQGSSLAIVDIDGYTMNGVNAEKKSYYKQATQEYIFNCLKDIPGAMFVRTQSGGYHIYLWNETVVDKVHETSNYLHFPSDFYISELAGKSLKHSIEIFTKDGSKQCLLPPSVVLNETTMEENTYSIISDVNTLSNIDTVNNIHETIKECLVTKHDFTYHKPDNTKQITPAKQNYDKPHELKNLSKTEIDNVVNAVIPVIQKLDGTKHTASLYLGGYFADNITMSSCNKVCNNIIHHIGNIFDDSNAFKKTIINNYTSDREDKAGLPKLCEIIQTIDPSFNIHKFKFEMNMNCKPNYTHSILYKEYSNNKKKYLDIDYTNNKISTHIWNNRIEIDDNGNQRNVHYWTDHYDLLNISPVDIFETYNILDKNASPKLCLSFYRKGMPSKQTIEGNDIQIIEKQLEKRPGIVLKPREYKGVVNEIINEYIKLEQIHTIEEIPVQGIFCNPLNGELVRADEHGSTPIILPSVDSVSQALSIWEDLYDVYPGDESKLAHIIRWGLVSPFSYILKTRFVWQPMLFLYGASRTSKTTLAEISLSPYTRITSEISIGGGAFNTEYRIGNALSRQGIGTIINEPSSSINNDIYIDLIKRAVESPISREKNENGVHIKVPAYSNMCFTSNSFIPTNDAFVRRADYLEFTKNERLSDDDIKLFNKTFNHQNWNNTRFLELRPIGDYLTSYVAGDVNILSGNHMDIVFGMVTSLFEYVGEKPFKWLYLIPELMDIGVSDNEVLSEFRRMILRDYKDLTRNSSKIYEYAFENAITVDENMKVNAIRHEGDFAKLLRAVISSNNIPYLHYQKVHDEEYVIVNGAVKNALKDFNGIQITCKGLADYMNQQYTNLKYKGNTVRGFRMRFSEFINFMNGGYVG